MTESASREPRRDETSSGSAISDTSVAATTSPPREADSPRPRLGAPSDFTRERRRIDQVRRTQSAGASIRVGDEDYELLSLRAVPKDAFSGPASAIAFERLGFVFVEGGDSSGLRVDGSFPVLSRRSNGMIAVVTGTFIVTLKDFKAAAPVAASYGLATKFLDESIRTVYLSAPPAAPLDELVGALKADPSIESVVLEVVQTHKRF